MPNFLFPLTDDHCCPEGKFDFIQMKPIEKNKSKWHTMVCYARPAKVCICFKRVAVELK